MLQTLSKLNDCSNLSRIVYFGLFHFRLQAIGDYREAPMDKTIYSSEYNAFLKLLKEARERAGVTQIQMAERLNATQTFVSKCERGDRRIDVVELHSWCVALGISMSDFVKNFEKNRT